MFVVLDVENDDIHNPVKTYDDAIKLAKKDLSDCSRGSEITIWKKIATVERDVKINVTVTKE